MAIGLGLMFGFRFLENFNYPLIASSITDFWRRWHMSLGSWFRDYVYIPLGGNRVSKLKLFRNIFIVWFLTGFWHGAAWNFIIWGLYFAVILIIEKFVLKKYLDKTHLIKYIYSLLLIIIGFLIFNSGSVNEILSSLKNMFFLSNIPVSDSITLFYFKNYIVLFIVAIILSTPLVKVVLDKLKETKVKGIVEVIEMVVIMALLILCVSFLIDASFNPFLYFRF
jgi:alginate O-acetyltransferase complex protein AlgI